MYHYLYKDVKDVCWVFLWEWKNLEQCLTHSWPSFLLVIIWLKTQWQFLSSTANLLVHSLTHSFLSYFLNFLNNAKHLTFITGGSISTESTCSEGDSLQCRKLGLDPWVWKIPWRRKWQPTPVFLSEKSPGQKSLVGYSPWGHEESDVT